jgi:hypothetical protein
MLVVLLILGICGSLLVLASTSQYGIGLSPDSVNYILGARRLLESSGLRQAIWVLPPVWPPLFPVLLAVLGTLAIDPQDGARILNTLAFGLIVLATGRLMGFYTKSQLFVLFGAITVLVSVPILSVSVMAWTEPLFILFMILFVDQLSRFLTEPRWTSLVSITVLAAIACLQRYIGVSLILTGGILIVLAMPKIGLTRRLQYAACFSIASLLPLAIWLTRNYRLSHSLMGERAISSATFQDNIYRLFDTLTKWFMPSDFPFETRLIVGSFILGLIVLRLVLLTSQWSSNFDPVLLQLSPIVVFPLVYTSLLLVSVSSVKMDAIDNRLLAPLYIFLLCPFFILLHYITKWRTCPNSMTLGIHNIMGAIMDIILVACVFIGVSTMAYSTAAVVTRFYQVGGGYNSIVWKESALTRWLVLHQDEIDGQVFSNDPEAVYIITSRIAVWIPWNKSDLSAYRDTLEQYWSTNGNNYLIWFRLSKRTDYEPQIFARVMELKIEPIESLPDGEVYVILK